MSTISLPPKYLDVSFTPEENVQLLLGGQFDVAPLPKINKEWERYYGILSKALIGISLAFGVVSLAVIRSRVFMRYFSTVGVIPVTLGALLAHLVAESRFKQEKKHNYNLLMHQLGAQLKEIKTVYEGMVTHLRQRRVDAEYKVIEAFNRGKEQRGPASEVERPWQLNVEGAALKKAYQDEPTAMELSKTVTQFYKVFDKKSEPDKFGLVNLIAEWKKECNPRDEAVVHPLALNKLFLPGTCAKLDEKKYWELCPPPKM